MAGDPRPKAPKPQRGRTGWNTTLPAATKRIPQRSAKREAEDDERRAVRAAVRARAGGRCEARHVVPEVTCWGPLDVDEVESRGTHPGAHLDEDLCQLVCRGHHDWRHANPAEATARGLRRSSTYDARLKAERGDR